MTDTAIEQRDEQVAEAITAGRSLPAVRREFGLTIAELDAVLEKMWPIDTAARLRMIKTDLGKLDRLIETFYTKALTGDVNSGVLTVKAWERKAALLGLDAVQRIDLQIIRPPEAVSSHEKIREAIMRLCRPERFANNGNGPPLEPPPGGWNHSNSEPFATADGSAPPDSAGAADASVVPDATNGGSDRR